MASPTPPHTAPGMRKQPTQERAQRTIDLILEATAQILEAEGEAALTTNHIARKAGFSIGTLYQYFPSKNAILLAIIHRHRTQAQHDLQALLDRAVAERQDVRLVLRDIVRMLVRTFGGTSGPHRAFVRMAWRLEHHDNITQDLREGAEREALALGQLIEAGHATGVRAPNPAMMYVVTRAVMGAVRSASLENSPLLGTAAFEDELVRLAWGVMRSDG